MNLPPDPTTMLSQLRPDALRKRAPSQGVPCSACGAHNAVEATACTACGARLEAVTVERRPSLVRRMARRLLRRR